jgi:hypothetical protein
MHRPASVPQSTASMWPGLHGWLVLVLLATGFLSWFWARPAMPAGHSELTYFMPRASALAQGTAFEPATSAPQITAQAPICGKPLLTSTPTLDQVFNEIADQDIPSCTGLWLALLQGAPAQGPQPELPQTERQPLLRPPARLG